jgi:gamma-glutamyl-gamma-aminobutyraldehyde dehydrogenase
VTRVQRLLTDGLAHGGRLVTGGAPAAVPSGLRGSYFAPTVVADTAPGHPLVREELFAPVLAVQVCIDEAQAIELAQDTGYGLAAAVWTADLGRAHRVSKALRAGTVWVNCYEEGDMSVPFGGVKLSGNARDKSRHALESYTDLKTTWLNYG